MANKIDIDENGFCTQITEDNKGYNVWNEETGDSMYVPFEKDGSPTFVSDSYGARWV